MAKPIITAIKPRVIVDAEAIGCLKINNEIKKISGEGNNGFDLL